MMDIEQYCEHYGLDYSKVRSYKLVTHTATPYYNIAFYETVLDTVDEETLGSIIDRLVSERVGKPRFGHFPNVDDVIDVDRVVWTDVHVGMDASREGLALYAQKWDSQALMDRVTEMAKFIIQNKKSDHLILDELGDFMDGWNAQTTRGGHALPQNMTNEQAFEHGLEAKLMLIDMLQDEYSSIICNNICEDNHAGAFGYVVNAAFQKIINSRFHHVAVVNHQRFMNHYVINKCGFIITHGKDSRNLKFGFKPVLDPAAIDKISQYIRHNRELRSCLNIEFSKGDSHQALFDMCSSDEFDYYNYPAFSPSSEWVQTNFKKGRSGFVMQHINTHTGYKVMKPYFFN
jgi:hypothetical protein